MKTQVTTVLAELKSKSTLINKPLPTTTMETLMDSPIVKRNREKSIEWLEKLIINANYDYSTNSLHKQDIKNYAERVYNFTIKEYPQLTLQEIKLAFEKGVSLVYGENYGMVPKTFYKWIKSFYKLNRYEEIQKRQPQSLQLSENTLSYNEEMLIDGINELNDQFTITKKIEDRHVNAYYDLLCVKGILNKEQLSQHKEQAKEELINDRKLRIKREKLSWERKELRRKGHNFHKKTIVFQCKKIMMYNHLEKHGKFDV